MLDRVKLMTQLQAVSDQVFLDFSQEYAVARASFQRISADPDFQSRIDRTQVPWLIPSWHGALDDAISMQTALDTYAVLGVDGSQIYPDRHQGTHCFFLNIGTVLLTYNPSMVSFSSIPYVYTQIDEEDVESSMDIVNCKRQELEFKAGLEHGIAYTQKTKQPPLFLFDGSLIFWHLESKDSKFKQRYIGQYVALLDQLYHARIPCAGYISLPKSKELVNLIRVELCSFVWDGCTKHTAVDHVTDTTIARFFLTQGTRTTVFKSNASIGSWYPEHLAPHFFYADMGSEIVRIEIPAWIAQEKELLAWMCAVIADQARKGQGYPIALAEAHEQAVVKGPDREFFYQLINKMSIEQQHRLLMSQKNSKKRCPGI